MGKFFVTTFISTILIISTSTAGLSQSETNIIPNIQYPLAKEFPITSQYGPRSAPVAGASTFHRGVDFATPIGTPVLASVAGTVVLTEYLRGYGYTLVIRDDSQQYEVLYAHLNRFIARKGQRVNAREVVAESGVSGLGSGPHLHVELRRVNGPNSSIPFNPNQSIQIALSNMKTDNVAALKDPTSPVLTIASKSAKPVKEKSVIEEDNIKLNFDPK
jgi:murein DD-endopeptidase MepM/ murein hydrolase activator NlpD